MPRSGLTDFLVNLIAGVLTVVLLGALGWLLWNAGLLDSVFGLVK